jgi:hypothetical protein
MEYLLNNSIGAAVALREAPAPRIACEWHPIVAHRPLAVSWIGSSAGEPRRLGSVSHSLVAAVDTMGEEAPGEKRDRSQRRVPDGPTAVRNNEIAQPFAILNEGASRRW